MPQNGDVSRRFGVYRTLCCGEEIVIAEGAIFPDCAQHAKLTTEWIAEDEIRHVSAYIPPKKKDTAA